MPVSTLQHNNWLKSGDGLTAEAEGRQRSKTRTPEAGACCAAARKAHSRRMKASLSARGDAGICLMRCVRAARDAKARKSRRPSACDGFLRTVTHLVSRLVTSMHNDGPKHRQNGCVIAYG